MSESIFRKLARLRTSNAALGIDAGYRLPEQRHGGEHQPPAKAFKRLKVALWVLLLCYFVVGVFGRFPWKADEPYSFGIVMEMLENGHWLIPHVADQSFLEKPPLVYWLGAASAKLLASVPPHESSRLAVLLLVGATLFFLYRSAGYLWPEVTRWRDWLNPTRRTTVLGADDGAASRSEYALFAVLLFAGTLGLTEQIHKFTADLGQLAGCVIALCGLIRLGTMAGGCHPVRRRAALIAGLTVGTGTGVAFMSKGLLVPGLIALTWLGCLALPAFRRADARTAGWAALIAALPWLLIWPALLHHASPELFDEWFWTNNVGRFLGHGDLGGNGVPTSDRMIALALAGFPALPLFAVALARGWRARATGVGAWTAHSQAPGHACLGVFLGTSLVVLFASASFRDNYLLPVLPALTLLGLPATAVSGERFVAVLKRCTDLFFGFTVVLVFWVWVQLVTTKTVWPSTLRASLAKLLPLPFELAVSWPSLVVGVLAVLLWRYLRRQPLFRGASASWCIGVAMLWVASFSLLLPWVDAARSYRAVFTDLRTMLAPPNCLATSNLGESELTMLEYVTGIEATRLHEGRSGSGDPSRVNPAARKCDWMLVLSKPATAVPEVDGEIWDHLWQGGRPADANERFDLYRKSRETQVRGPGASSRP